MAAEAEPLKTSVLFTAPNERADAIGIAAAVYAEQEITAEVMPIVDAETADDAFVAVRRQVGDRWFVYPQAAQQAVYERYEALGEAGTTSLVRLTVPEGVPSFDWAAFYERVATFLV
ncbi:MAG TPA: hypothetical protein VHA37_09455 [Candidatus Saccharimonadales bacterium]|nr:hypothetical protein [Candidatus Saccharimonadales bacterium]